MKAEQLKGHLDLLLMAALEAGPAHGYAIAETLRTRSGQAFDLSEGTLYPALHRLERAAFLASRWQDHGGRRRRIYQITAKGRRALSRQREEWTAFRMAMGAVVGEQS